MSSNKSIKIYIIVPSLNIGGTEKHILNVFSKLSKEIYNIFLDIVEELCLSNYRFWDDFTCIITLPTSAWLLPIAF